MIADCTEHEGKKKKKNVSVSTATSSIPGRHPNPALSRGWLGTRYTYLLMYILSRTLG
jgi:hypothetical protein